MIFMHHFYPQDTNVEQETADRSEVSALCQEDLLSLQANSVTREQTSCLEESEKKGKEKRLLL